FLSVEDNVPAHNAAVSNQARDENDIQRLVHPSSSPDLNPIENMWGALKTCLYAQW
ncbi:transposable element Tcb1 transposase, partial [Violaceomyces palustris]